MTLSPKSFLYEVDGGVATITLNRPERINALTFEVYGELRDTFIALEHEKEVRAVVLRGEGPRGFCSGGDVEDIIGALFSRDMQGLIEFTRMTGALVHAIRTTRPPVVAALHNVVCGAGAVIALACDVRIAAPDTRIAYLFPKVGLSGADMGAAYLLPRIVGLGRATELLLTGEFVDAERAERIGLINRIAPADTLRSEAAAFAKALADGPAFAHAMTKRMLEYEGHIDFTTAIEAEAQAQAICMQHPDFREAHDAWKEKATTEVRVTDPGDVIERAFVPEELIAPAWDAAGALAAEAVALEEAAPNPSEGLKALVARFGDSGLLALLAPADVGGAFDHVRSVALCLVRERLGFASPLADLAFTMQGLGSYAITLTGDDEQKARWLPDVIGGKRIAALALTEPEAGSDLSQIATTAKRDGEDYVLDGEKIWISNAPIAGLFTVLAATKPRGERRRFSAFVVPGDADGLSTEAQSVLGGHPIGKVRFDGVRVPAADRLGAEGDGMRAALGTLHVFRTTVGAAAVGFAARALAESAAHVNERQQFGAPLAALQAVQMRIADMACDVDASRLLVYRAAALADAGAGRDAVSHAGSMAKLVATEAAQRVIDHGVQLHGGRGVATDSVVGRLYQEIRALRIYEGTTDVQKILVARAVLNQGS